MHLQLVFDLLHQPAAIGKRLIPLSVLISYPFQYGLFFILIKTSAANSNKLSNSTKEYSSTAESYYILKKVTNASIEQFNDINIK